MCLSDSSVLLNAASASEAAARDSLADRSSPSAEAAAAAAACLSAS